MIGPCQPRLLARIHTTATRYTALFLAAALSCLPFFYVPAHAASEREGALQGKAHVIDGDTLEISGRRVRLFGIDAPELQQTCGRRWFGQWPCGRTAQRRLRSMISGRQVACLRRGRDRYQRILALCYAGGRELNAELVRQGLAWAFVKYTTEYVRIEDAARARALGIWQGPAEPAWKFRETRWLAANRTAPNGCPIKGNITSSGRIYHTPWSPWYDKTRVEPEKGERWFCNERDALKAGWRPSHPGQ